MEAVPRMPMIWLELKEAGEFQFSSRVFQFIKRNYGEKPENFSDALGKLEQLRKAVVNIPRDFEGCNTLKKYLGQLHFLQSRVPMAYGQEAASPVTWFDIFSGKQVTHEDIGYEQACVLYNIGALHSYLGSMDNRVSEEGMKTSCTHFQSAAGAFTHIRDYYNSNYSPDLIHHALSININLMLGQAQECLLEKTLLDNKKSLITARICAQVSEYYRECIRVLENSDSLSGKKEWRKLLCMKISYFSAIKHFHMGKHSEEQQKYGEAVAYFQLSLSRLNDAIKLGKGQPESIHEALKFTMDIIGGKFNSAKKDNDFIYHEPVPKLEALAVVKGAPLVKPLPVNLTDPNTTGPDLFSRLVPLAAHESSSVYSEEKAKLLREVMAKIEAKNRVLESFMNSLNCDAVDPDVFISVPSVLLEKCAALSVQPDAVKRLAQAMQAFSSVYTDVGSNLEDVRSALEEAEAREKTPELTELQNEFKKYEAVHQAASQSNTELHQAMNQHIPNLRLLQGPLEELRNSLPRPQLSQDTSSLQTMQRICAKVDEMRKQRVLLEKELRDLIMKDDITDILVTTERSERKILIEEHMQKYGPLKGYIDQNLAAQDNIIKALTEANVLCAAIRKTLNDTKQQWNSSVQSLVASYETYENLVKKAEEGKSFYQDLEKKTTSLLEKVKVTSKSREEDRTALLERGKTKVSPPTPAPRKTLLGNKTPGPSVSSCSNGQDLPQELPTLSPNMTLAKGPPVANPVPRGPAPFTWAPGAACLPFLNHGMPQSIPTTQLHYGQVLGSPHPMVPMEPPPGYTVPQQFQPGPPRGITPVPPQINFQNASQTPHQGFIPAPFPIVSGNYPATGPGQHIQPNMPESSSAQVTPETQYQGYPPLSGYKISTQGPRVAFFGQTQPSSHPGQFQPPVLPQGQSQPVPSAAYWPVPVSQGIALSEGNMYFQGGIPSSQGLPAQNLCEQPTTPSNPLFPTGNLFQNQHIPPPNNPITVPVIDNPNPPVLGGILTPSPAHTFSSNQTTKPPSAENLLTLTEHKEEAQQINPSHGAVNPDLIQEKMGNLSITSQGEV
ncbi:tyrosine-protein phosphatase non-receptor type 23b isoform X2 [Silurus meridionalis]|uniref:tyrosine-protein phosphatase non-receptor type 23b isoform X2 n=1 Tax=Silurus meridionalis TaxID=175797 RepID=UPI001EEC8A0A|nr:tyrosine-protein phosphatase non-receptor type 23b isoform X2 [Silurus meridionalis]